MGGTSYLILVKSVHKGSESSKDGAKSIWLTISCLHSSFPLEGRKGLSRSPFIHTGAAGAHLHLPFTIYNFPYVFPASQDSTESGAKKEALLRELLSCL